MNYEIMDRFQGIGKNDLPLELFLSQPQQV